MEFALIAFVWFLNFGISFWNSYAVGTSWPYTKQIGGLAHLVNWCGFIMAGCGFSWCLLLPLSLVSYYYHWFGFDQQELVVTMSLGYLILAPMIILSGLGIWIDSLVQAWKTKSFANIAVAGYNTYAQISNMVDVAKNYPSSFNTISDFFKDAFSNSKDSDDFEHEGSAKGVIILAIFVIFWWRLRLCQVLC
jgi:hypothetical protein